MGCLFSKPLIRCNAEGAADSLLAHLDVRKEKKHLQITFLGYTQCAAGLVMNDILISRLDMANSELNESCRAWQLRRPWRYASN